MEQKTSYEIEDYFILDVRDSEEYEEKHIEGSVNIPCRMILVTEYPGSTGFYLTKIPKDKIILLFCNSGKRACQAQKVLVKNDYSVFNILTYEHAEDFVKSLKEFQND